MINNGMSKHFKYAIILIFFTTCLVHGLWLQNKVLDLEACFKAQNEYLENRYGMLSRENSFFRSEISKLREKLGD